MRTEAELLSAHSFPATVTDHDRYHDLYNTALASGSEYRRGVGTFTPAWIESAARGMTDFVENGGTARWLTTPELAEADREAIVRGKRARRDEELRAELKPEVERLETSLTEEARNAFAWMVADGIVDIRITLPDETHPTLTDVCIVVDERGDRVKLPGDTSPDGRSLQERDRYRIECDWKHEAERESIETAVRQFETVWEAEDTTSLPPEIERDISGLRTTDERPYDVDSGALPPERTDIVLRDYQRDAVDAWEANGRRGLFEMATGTGKTYTALGALRETLESLSEPAVTVVAVPVTHLAYQWEEDVREFGLEGVELVFNDANRDWQADLHRVCSEIDLGHRDRAVFLTTHRTLGKESFRRYIETTDATRILIGDEVHRLGAPQLQAGLSEAFDYRIGLSATPERYYDEEGTEELLDYFEGTVFRFTLGEAIPEYLTPYEYHPVVVELTADERREYEEMTSRLVAASEAEEVDDETALQLANKRAEVVKAAESKYGALREVLDDFEATADLLVYTNHEQIDRVQEILNDEDLVQRKITYEQDDAELRQEIIDDFAEGEYQAIVAMRVLDEGMDVPPARRAILMSNSGNPMQYVQRRGRVLRRHPGKDRAVIYDLIVVPSLDPPADVRKTERNIVRTELDRVDEFVDHAINADQARLELNPLRLAYDL